MVDNTSYLIRSSDRTSGTAQSGVYSFIPAGTILPGTYELLSFQMANNLYNVELGVNDEIYFDEGAAELGPVNLTPGSYTGATLLTEIVAQMNSVSGSTYNTSTFNAAQQTFTITIAAGTFSFNWSTNSTQPLANDLMGWTVVDTTLAASHTSDSTVNLALHRNILIDISQDGQQAVTILDGTEFSFLIPIDSSSSFGGQIDYQKAEGFGQNMVLSSVLNTLNISLHQESGTALPNVTDWSLHLRRLF